MTELRFWRGVIVGAIVAIIGWLVVNYQTAANVIICIAVGSFVILLFVLVTISYGISENIQAL